MAPNKFEKHIKKQLNEREITPSKDSWDRVQGQLNDSSETKSKGFFWYGIAASFIGILIISVLYFNNGNDQVLSNIQIVETAVDTVKQGEKIETNVFEGAIEIEVVAIPNKTSQNSKQATEVIAKENHVTAVEDKMIAFEKEAIATEIQITVPDEIINTKILEVIAQVSILEEDASALTDAEVDSLLRNAQKEILTNELFKQNGSIDAMALLTEVEVDLDQSFRDKVFESLKNKFLKSKTAVANRNN